MQPRSSVSRASTRPGSPSAATVSAPAPRCPRRPIRLLQGGRSGLSLGLADQAEPVRQEGPRRMQPAALTLELAAGAGVDDVREDELVAARREDPFESRPAASGAPRSATPTSNGTCAVKKVRTWYLEFFDPTPRIELPSPYRAVPGRPGRRSFQTRFRTCCTTQVLVGL